MTHAAELPCLWPGTARKPLTPQRRRLSLEMVRYWGAFTKDAHPAGAHPKDADPATREQAAWPPYRSGKLMSLLPGRPQRDRHLRGVRGTAPVLLLEPDQLRLADHRTG
ncbi:hypothetical protein [Streptomyces sp. HNM1019]|uniref:hypothetical protein n=1 Tax=Streptomyces sp. HNM1019 TaxID=3424717 RepID=UPI003D78AC43